MTLRKTCWPCPFLLPSPPVRRGRGVGGEGVLSAAQREPPLPRQESRTEDEGFDCGGEGSWTTDARRSEALNSHHARGEGHCPGAANHRLERDQPHRHALDPRAGQGARAGQGGPAAEIEL